jgi:hypothetical protein
MKLIVAGCSVSDYTQVKLPYGEILFKTANKFSSYVHNAAGCGSNYRIMRTVTNQIMNGDITSDDLLIVQWTTYERDEIASAFNNPDAKIKNRAGGRDIVLRDYFAQDIDIVRFKSRAQDFFHLSDIEKEYVKLKEEWFTHVDFERERFNSYAYMFQQMLLQKNIKVVFFKFFDYAQEFQPVTELSHLLFEYRPDPSLYLAPDDPGHLNQKGHTIVATELQKFLKTRSII